MHVSDGVQRIFHAYLLVFLFNLFVLFVACLGALCWLGWFDALRSMLEIFIPAIPWGNDF